MRHVLSSLCLASVLFSACGPTDSGPVTAGGAAGTGGKAAGGAGPSAGTSASGASGAGDGGDAAGEAGAPDAPGAAGAPGPSVCAESGQGQIELMVTGLPKTVAASIVISGASEALESESTTLSDAPAGTYTVRAKRVYDDNPLVRTAYDAQVEPAAFCLEADTELAVAVNYAKVAPSNQLWTLNGGGGRAPLLGFDASKLTDSGSPEATTSVELPVGTSMVFDHDGNLWAAGATVAEPTVARYASAWLAGVGEPHADFAFNLALGCVPAVKAVALDASGNVWLSACNKRIVRIDRPDTTPGADEESIDIVPSVTLSGLSEQNEDLAFDRAGNLWLAAGGRVLRFDHARLASDDADAPDLVLDVTSDDATPQALAANFLAFDVAGNLWAGDFAGNAVFELGKADLDARGANTVVAKVRVTLAVQALISRPAFDAEGSLWLSLSAGKFGKLTAEQLAVSSSAAAPTNPAFVISSSDVGYADGLSFFPAASGLPLASAQP